MPTAVNGAARFHAREPKIEQPGVGAASRVARQKNIRRLDVAMHDANLVRARERSRSAASAFATAERCCPFAWPLPIGLSCSLQIGAVQPLHHQRGARRFQAGTSRWRLRRRYPRAQPTLAVRAACARPNRDLSPASGESIFQRDLLSCLAIEGAANHAVSAASNDRAHLVAFGCQPGLLAFGLGSIAKLGLETLLKWRHGEPR